MAGREEVRGGDGGWRGATSQEFVRHFLFQPINYKFQPIRSKDGIWEKRRAKRRIGDRRWGEGVVSCESGWGWWSGVGLGEGREGGESDWLGDRKF